MEEKKNFRVLGNIKFKGQNTNLIDGQSNSDRAEGQTLKSKKDHRIKGYRVWKKNNEP